MEIDSASYYVGCVVGVIVWEFAWWILYRFIAKPRIRGRYLRRWVEG